MASLPCSPSQRFVFKPDPRQDAGGDPSINPPPGVWWFWKGQSPWITCPECGEAGRLGNHSIAADGKINPSIVCPMGQCGDGEVRCTAHYYGRLEGWSAGAVEPMR